MGFRYRFAYIMPFVLLLILCISSASATGTSDLEITVVANSVPSESMDGSLESFDISPAGDILLFFQDASAYGICTAQILDPNGQFKAEYRITSKQSGSVLACFNDNGEIVVYYVRADQAYTIKGAAVEQVSFSKKQFLDSEVPPVAQREDMTLSYDGAQYTLSPPGFLDSYLNGTGYTLTCKRGSTEQIVWSGSAENIPKSAVRSLCMIPIFFSIISIVLLCVALKNKQWPASAKGLLLLHIGVIIAAWIFILLMETGKIALSWQNVGPFNILSGVLISVLIMLLVDVLVFGRCLKHTGQAANG